MRKFGINFANLIFGIVLIALGIFFCAGNTELLTKIIFIIIGISMIATNIVPLIYSIRDKIIIEIIYRLILVVFGILFIFYHNTALCIIAGLLFIVLPIINIILSNNRRDELMIQLPSIILGVVILVLGPSALGKALFIVLGVISIILGVIAFLSSFYKQKIIQ